MNSGRRTIHVERSCCRAGKCLVRVWRIIRQGRGPRHIGESFLVRTLHFFSCIDKSETFSYGLQGAGSPDVAGASRVINAVLPLPS